MKKRIISIAVALLLIISLVPSAYAADDTTPPSLDGVTLNAYAFNRGDTLTVTAQSIENESGFDVAHCRAEFVWVNPIEYEGSLDDFSMALDTEVPGVGVQGSLVLDERVGGTFRLSGLTLTDKRGNTRHYAECYGNLPSVTFTLISDYIPPEPETLPLVTDFTTSKRDARVGDTVTYTITAEHSTGIASASAYLQIPGAVTSWLYGRYNIPLTPVEGKEGTFSGSITITPDMPDAIYLCQVTAVANSGKEGHTQYFDTRLHVINPGNPAVKISPEILSYSFSTHEILPGGTLSLSVSIDSRLTQVTSISASLRPKNFNSNIYHDYVDISLTSRGGGVFSGECDIPYGIRSGEYTLGYFCAWVASGDGICFGGKSSFYAYDEDGIPYLKDGVVKILPILTVSGTDNRTLLVGDAFDPMQGVTATNALTGDITSKITMVGGDIDTSVPGLYLIKYIISDTVSIDGVTTTLSYIDYRWIGVSEIEPSDQSGDVPLAVTDGNLAIGATSADVSIQKDGVSVPFSNVMTEPGEYTLSSSESASSTSMASGTLSLSEGDSSTVTAVIDRTGPVLNAAWGKNASQAIVVTVKASDVSGVAETKYMAGTCSLEQCKSGGTAFTRTFTVVGYGKYTVYARDGLGYESVTTYNINSASSSNSAYVESVGVSAGTLSRSFSKTCYSYKVNLGENEGSTTITPVKEFDGATMTINGQALSSYTANVANGKSVTVKVKVSYGKTSHTYTFTVTRAKSTNNNLASLSASTGSFDKAFDPAVTNYTLTLDENTKSTKITNTVAAPGLAKASPSSTTVTLSNGQTKVVKITVKAQSGLKKTYVITVTRAASTNATLKSLKTNSGKCPLSPAFSAGVTNYTVALPATTGSVTISAAAAGYKAVVYIDGKKKTSQKVSVASGGSVTVHIVVTAQAGNTMDYYVTVTRP